MKNPRFNPGFRISLMDAAVLCAGATGSFLLGGEMEWAGWIVAIVVLHFFLFCNVFRISRRSELIWAAAFIILCTATIWTGVPGWIAAFILSIVLAGILIWRETRRESYHGILWARWNPGLPAWWEARHATPPSTN